MIEILKIYTDGACTNNGKKNAKAGCGVYWPEPYTSLMNKSFPLRERHAGAVTNQRAELAAILCVLQQIAESPTMLEMYDKIVIHSDSDYSVKCMTTWAPKWKAKRWIKADGKVPVNLDIVKPALAAFQKLRKRVSLKWVKGHSTTPGPDKDGNDKADALASEGARKDTPNLVQIPKEAIVAADPVKKILQSYSKKDHALFAKLSGKISEVNSRGPPKTDFQEVVHAIFRCRNELFSGLTAQEQNRMSFLLGEKKESVASVGNKRRRIIETFDK